MYGFVAVPSCRCPGPRCIIALSNYQGPEVFNRMLIDLSCSDPVLLSSACPAIVRGLSAMPSGQENH